MHETILIFLKKTSFQKNHKI